MMPSSSSLGLAAMTAFLLCYSGSGLTALGMERHYAQWRGHGPARGLAIMLRIAGTASWFLALFCCVKGWGGPIGSVACFGFFAIGGLCWIALWSWAHRLALAMLVVASAVAALALLVPLGML